MSFDVLFSQFMSGIARAALLFLVASGLSLTFGVLRVLNFAHGSLYMLGAFLSYSIWKFLLMPVLGFYLAAVIAALIAMGDVRAEIIKKTLKLRSTFQDATWHLRRIRYIS